MSKVFVFSFYMFYPQFISLLGKEAFLAI